MSLHDRKWYTTVAFLYAACTTQDSPKSTKYLSRFFLLRRRQDFDKQTLIRLYWR